MKVAANWHGFIGELLHSYRDLIMLGGFQIGNLQLQKSVFSEYT